MNTLIVQRYIRLHKSSILSLVFLSAIGFYLWRATHFVPPKIQCFVQAPVSDLAQKKLKEFISAQHSKSLKPKDFIKDLKDSFLWIKDISLVMEPSLISITILPDTPFAVINNSMVLTQEGKVFEKDIFIAQTLGQLPILTVDGEALNYAHTFEKIALFFKTAPQELFNFYTVTWKNDHAVYLADKAHTNFIVIVSADRQLISKKLGDCLHIKKTLHTQLIKKPIDQWTADTRFADRIIVTKRGISHGSNVS